jgi:hypothetical protein
MSDEEMMQIDDDDVMPIKSKGKGKAIENGESDDNLPWYASKRVDKLTIFRVEKYRPKSLDEVVSHNDIISTSTLK